MVKKKKKRGKWIFIAALMLLIIVISFGYIAELVLNTSVDGEKVSVQIPKGASSEEIGKILKQEKLIKSVNIFKLRAHFSDNGQRMNYGSFELHRGMCIPDIIDTLAGTYSYRPTVTFTVPEGFSIQQIAARSEELGICTKEEFLKAAENKYDYKFLNSIPENSGADYALQGFLYPETYEFFCDAKPEEVIDKMLGQFEKEIKGISLPDGKTWYEIVTVASLLEREALLDREMPVIAGVIYNRINKGMRLQIDATVQYAVTGGKYNINRVTYDDLKIDSPYNTYRVYGLPAGPISSVSISAVKAAINPEKHEYLYYHTDKQKNDGSHIFTKTYDEHLTTMN